MKAINNFNCPRCNRKNNLVFINKTRNYNEFKCPTCSLKIKFKV